MDMMENQVEDGVLNFSDLKLSRPTLKAIHELGFSQMTPIQTRCILPALDGKNLLGSAKTGSGKTLGFLVPSIEVLCRTDLGKEDGTGVVVISPTRELALQIFGIAEKLFRFHSWTLGITIGGTKRKTEAEQLEKGVSFLVATPGRFLDHLQKTGFVIRNLRMLVIDEADRILEAGFEKEMDQILGFLPKERQTLLFSATLTPQVEGLARIAFSHEPIYVNVDSDRIIPTNKELEQGYVVCPSEKRFLVLFSFLRRNANKKIIVFFSSCNAVRFYGELLNYIDLPVLDLHGNQKQSKRTKTFFDFTASKTGILLCTDVGSRGLDIPAVDWIVQYDPSDSPREYIHRVGRTARAGKAGKALLFLLPTELRFLRYLKMAKLVLDEYDFSENKIIDIQKQLEQVVEKNYYLNKSAKDGFSSYIQAYASHSLKTIFNVHQLDLNQVAKSFGFSTAPNVHIKTGTMASKTKRRLARLARREVGL